MEKETTFYRFYSEIRGFLSKLISDPIKAEPSKYLKDRNDVGEINAYFAKYSAKVEKFNKEIDEKEVTLDIIKISDNDFLKALKANDKDFSYMEQFEWMIC